VVIIDRIDFFGRINGGGPSISGDMVQYSLMPIVCIVHL